MNNLNPIPGCPPGMSTMAWAQRQSWARRHPVLAEIREAILAASPGPHPCADCGRDDEERRSHLYVISYTATPPEYVFRCRTCADEERIAYRKRTNTQERTVTA